MIHSMIIENLSNFPKEIWNNMTFVQRNRFMKGSEIKTKIDIYLDWDGLTYEQQMKIYHWFFVRIGLQK